MVDGHTHDFYVFYYFRTTPSNVPLAIASHPIYVATVPEIVKMPVTRSDALRDIPEAATVLNPGSNVTILFASRFQIAATVATIAATLPTRIQSCVVSLVDWTIEF